MHCCQFLVGRFALRLEECREWHGDVDVVCRNSSGVSHFLTGGAFGVKFDLVLLNLKNRKRDLLHCYDLNKIMRLNYISFLVFAVMTNDAVCHWLGM